LSSIFALDLLPHHIIVVAASGTVTTIHAETLIPATTSEKPPHSPDGVQNLRNFVFPRKDCTFLPPDVTGAVVVVSIFASKKIPREICINIFVIDKNGDMEQAVSGPEPFQVPFEVRV